MARVTVATRGTTGARRLGVAALVSLVAGFAAWAYAGAASLGFLRWDDVPFILRNPHLRGPGWDDLAWMLTGQWGGNWQPLTWLSHALDLALFGEAPAGHHLVNVAVHALVALALAWISARLIAIALAAGGHSAQRHAAALGGAAAGVLFAVHPQHVEAVAWVSERKELLGALFYLAALYAYLRFAAAGGARWRWGAVACHLLALLAKPMAVTLPAALLLVDVYPLRRTNWRARVVEKWPHIALSAAVVPVAVWAQGSAGALSDLDTVGLGQRLLNAAHSLFLYPAKLLAPLRLAPFYPYPSFVETPGARALLPVAGVVLLAVLAVLAWRRGARAWIVAAAWYVVTLLPVLGLVHFGSHAAADRYAYLPTMPAYVLAGAAVAWLLVRGPGTLRAAVVAAVAVVAITLGLVTRALVPVWQSDRSLWTYAIARAPGAPLPRANLGNVLFEDGDLSGAAAHYEYVLLRHPDHARARRNLALTYVRMGRGEAALAHYALFLQRHPGAADVRVEMGILLVRLRRWDEAAAAFSRASADGEDSAQLHYGVGLVAAARGDLGAARRHASRALELEPGHAGARELERQLAALPGTRSP